MTRHKITEQERVEWISKLRREGLHSLNSSNTFLLRQSIAREAVARTIILPKAKEVFGNKLNALLLFGSSQLGIRKAVGESDIDCIMVVQSFSNRQIRSMLGLSMTLVSKMGLDFMPSRIWVPGRFRIHAEKGLFGDSVHGLPFQIIYGYKFIHDLLPLKVLEDRKLTRADWLSSDYYKCR